MITEGTGGVGGPATDGDPSEDALQRLHVLTPLLQSWRYVVAAVGAALVFFRDNLDGLWRLVDFVESESALTIVLEVLAGLLVLLAAATGWAFLVWRMTRYAVAERTLFVRRGVVMRQRRQLRLDRIQGVDVQEPLLARLGGLAQLRIEMAAGQGATTSLGYLRLPEAHALRAELLSRSGRLGGSVEGEPVVERTILQVSALRVLQARLLEIGLGIALVVVYVVVATGVTVSAGLGFGALIGILAPVAPVAIGLVLTALRRFVRDANFTLTESGEGLRIHSGLLSLSHRTIPAGRVQAVHLREPLLWRPFGWAQLTVDVAGTSAGGSGGSGGSGGNDNQPAANTLVPVASRAEAATILAGVVGLEVDGVAMSGVPRRASRLDPMAWRWLGVGLTDEVAVTRTGWLDRQLAVVPFARIQSVRARQGPLQRGLGLASVHLDGAQGAQGWSAAHRDVDDALVLVQVLAARAGELRRTEDVHR
ncbi:MAG: PH domain-containing protein [Actinomycetota bacterium]|nr:PH domain-containing protein [Actinomycetota bacterium]